MEEALDIAVHFGFLLVTSLWAIKAETGATPAALHPNNLWVRSLVLLLIMH